MTIRNYNDFRSYFDMILADEESYINQNLSLIREHLNCKNYNITVRNNATSVSIGFELPAENRLFDNGFEISCTFPFPFEAFRIYSFFTNIKDIAINMA